MGLGWADNQAPSYLSGRFLHAYPSPRGVDPSDPQCRRLPESQTRPAEEPHQGCEVTAFVSEPHNSGDWSAKLVANAGKELVLGADQLLESLVGGFPFPKMRRSLWLPW